MTRFSLLFCLKHVTSNRDYSPFLLFVSLIKLICVVSQRRAIYDYRLDLGLDAFRRLIHIHMVHVGFIWVQVVHNLAYIVGPGLVHSYRDNYWEQKG